MRRGALAFLLTAGTALAAPTYPRFTAPPDPAGFNSVEARLWYQSRQQDDALKNVGALYQDPALDAYLAEMCAKLFPEMQGTLRIRVVRDALPNAFMMPNGSGYFHAGMLALIENEAQLAAILAHEGGHYVDRHGARDFAHRSATGTAMSWLSLGGLGAQLFALTIGSSSVFGYSRDLESTADAIALERMRAAGYDVTEGAKPFTALGEYYTGHKIKEPLFYATHPRLKERVEFFQGAAKGGEAGAVNADAYRAATHGVRMFVLSDMMRQRDHATLIQLLEDDARRAAWPTESGYHLAMALRLRAKDGDAERAKALLESTLAAVPEFAPTYKALGDVLMKAGDPGARALYQRYLELSPDAADRGFVERNLTKLASGDPR